MLNQLKCIVFANNFNENEIDLQQRNLGLSMVLFVT